MDLEDGTLFYQQMKDKIAQCTNPQRKCICPIPKVDGPSYCGGKNSICGEEPLQKYGVGNFDPVDQTNFANCYNGCTANALAYNGFAQKCQTKRTGSN